MTLVHHDRASGPLPDVSRPVRDWLDTAHYPSFGPSIPDLILGRWPQGVVSSSPYRLWACDQPGELTLVNRFLDAPLAGGIVGLLRLVAQADDVLPSPSFAPYPNAAHVTCFEPPRSGWPHLILVTSVGLLTSQYRGRYTWQAMETPEEAQAVLDQLAIIVVGKLKRPPVTFLKYPRG